MLVGYHSEYSLTLNLCVLHFHGLIDLLIVGLLPIRKVMKSAFVLFLFPLAACVKTMQIVSFRDAGFSEGKVYRRFLVKYPDDKDLVAKVAVEQAFVKIFSIQDYIYDPETYKEIDFRKSSTTAVSDHQLFVPGRTLSTNQLSDSIKKEEIDGIMTITLDWEKSTQEVAPTILFQGSGGGGGTTTTHLSLLTVTVFDAAKHSRVWFSQIKVAKELSESALVEIAGKVRIQMKLDKLIDSD